MEMDSIHHIKAGCEGEWLGKLRNLAVCPLCLKVKNKRVDRFQRHLRLTHMKHRVLFDGVYVVVCTARCTQSIIQGHYHCTCGQIVGRRDNMILHVRKHQEIGTVKPQVTPQRRKSPNTLQASTINKPSGSLIVMDVDASPSKEKHNKDVDGKTSTINKPSVSLIVMDVDASPPSKEKHNEHVDGNMNSNLDDVDNNPEPRRVLHRADKKTCNICGKSVSRSNFGKHRRIHKATKTSGRAILVDPGRGIYMVSKAEKGSYHPLHVQFKVCASVQRISCENKECMNLMRDANAGEDTHVSLRCRHIDATTDADPFPKQGFASDSTLERLISEGILAREVHVELLGKRDEARACQSPDVVSWHTGGQYIYLSVFDSNEYGTHYNGIGRIVVRYDCKTYSLDCSCCNRKKGCIHKEMSIWHIAGVWPNMMEASTDITEDLPEETVEGCSDQPIIYTPSKAILDKMLEYEAEHKRIPAHIKSTLVTSAPEAIYPRETSCLYCQESSQLVSLLITKSACIVDIRQSWRGIHVYVNVCPHCHCFYRYQEYDEGLHNFNNSLFLTIDLCLYLRALVRTHNTIGRALDALAFFQGDKLPHVSKIPEAYLHFESLTNHTYDVMNHHRGDATTDEHDKKLQAELSDLSVILNRNLEPVLVEHSYC